MKRLLPLLPLMAALALAGCHKLAAKTTEAQTARAVRVVTVADMPITGALAASGDLVPREEAAVLPEVGGYRVSRVLVDVGDTVKKGQTLVTLDPALVQAQLAQAEAVAAQAQVQALQAADQANRVKDLDNAGVLSQEAIDQRRFQARAAQATANAQAAALKDLRTRISKLSVSAPVSGLVLERTVRPGDMSATASTTPWFRLARDSEIELAAQLSEDDLAKIRPGQHADVTLPSGAVVQGVVRLVSPQIDNATKLGVVRVHLPVGRDIRAGGFGRAVFNEVSGLALAAPETAIRYDADGASVMVVGPDNRVKHYPVQTGQRGGGYVQLIKGPPRGSHIVQNAAAFLLDGDLVKPTDAADPPGSFAAPGKVARK
ncbi:MAG TPA: efflux RND transporter periplasmic adaptor subunit [Phenylobacterium sp.]|jgi:HlyD family secretion protein|uniref:efflux RND transporter periplasmic adaptor subunit n=1 Tax=Phenylobacterium sp. TaxID=1871053 RepID=UPI002B578CF6|nr:efflux RND transporter periplasmic adaptor subunit [Phenylobacterium sp.]HXA38881.1 efflux RND transporter periplasmic adaptor subunit [Phenylobacterium sp.]